MDLNDSLDDPIEEIDNEVAAVGNHMNFRALNEDNNVNPNRGISTSTPNASLQSNIPPRRIGRLFSDRNRREVILLNVSDLAYGRVPRGRRSNQIKEQGRALPYIFTRRMGWREIQMGLRNLFSGSEQDSYHILRATRFGNGPYQCLGTRLAGAAILQHFRQSSRLRRVYTTLNSSCNVCTQRPQVQESEQRSTEVHTISTSEDEAEIVEIEQNNEVSIEQTASTSTQNVSSAAVQLPVSNLSQSEALITSVHNQNINSTSMQSGTDHENMQLEKVLQFPQSGSVQSSISHHEILLSGVAGNAMIHAVEQQQNCSLGNCTLLPFSYKEAQIVASKENRVLVIMVEPEHSESISRRFVQLIEGMQVENCVYIWVVKQNSTDHLQAVEITSALKQPRIHFLRKTSPKATRQTVMESLPLTSSVEELRTALNEALHQRQEIMQEEQARSQWQSLRAAQDAAFEHAQNADCLVAQNTEQTSIINRSSEMDDQPPYESPSRAAEDNISSVTEEEENSLYYEEVIRERRQEYVNIFRNEAVDQATERLVLFTPVGRLVREYPVTFQNLHVIYDLACTNLPLNLEMSQFGTNNLVDMYRTVIGGAYVVRIAEATVNNTILLPTDNAEIPEELLGDTI